MLQRISEQVRYWLMAFDPALLRLSAGKQGAHPEADEPVEPLLGDSEAPSPPERNEIGAEARRVAYAAFRYYASLVRSNVAEIGRVAM